jgi:hypothetical protein
VHLPSAEFDSCLDNAADANRSEVPHLEPRMCCHDHSVTGLLAISSCRSGPGPWSRSVANRK